MFATTMTLTGGMIVRGIDISRTSGTFPSSGPGGELSFGHRRFSQRFPLLDRFRRSGMESFRRSRSCWPSHHTVFPVTDFIELRVDRRGSIPTMTTTTNEADEEEEEEKEEDETADDRTGDDTDFSSGG